MPAELFLHRRLRARLDLMRPDLGGEVFNRQRDKKSRMDNGKREREFTSGGKPKWLDGATVAEQTALSAL